MPHDYAARFNPASTSNRSTPSCTRATSRPGSIEQRREAWQSFLEKDWPQRNEEEWIRTDIRLFKLNQFCAAGATAATSAKRAPRHRRCSPKASSSPGSTTSLDSRPRRSRTRSQVGRARASSSAASTSWSTRTATWSASTSSRGPSIRTTTSSPPCTPPAGRAGICSMCRGASRSTSRCTASRRSATAASIWATR